MALRAVPDHPKFAALKASLGISKAYTLGCLEALWHFAGRFTPQGNIGKYPNETIEAWIEWDGEPGKLVASMIKTGWLIPNEEHRLVAWKYGLWSGQSKRSRRWLAIKAAGGEATPLMRTRIFARDHNRCVSCGISKDLTLDHILAVSRGGRTSLENLQILCRPCNSRKKDLEVRR